MDGAVQETFTYGTYGELTSGDPQATPFLYNGQFGIITDDNGLYYMRARYYNVEVKRFVNRDTLRGDIGNGQSLNRYSYVEGNPVMNVDPDGHFPISWNDVKEWATAVGQAFKPVATWVTGAGWMAAADGPLPVGEAVVVGGVVVIGGWVILREAGKGISDWYKNRKKAGVPSRPATLGRNGGEIYDNGQILRPEETEGLGLGLGLGILLTKPKTDDEECRDEKLNSQKNGTSDPNPYARPGQKKQGRENREKKKKENWRGNPNKRKKPLKKHTPGKTHRKYK